MRRWKDRRRPIFELNWGCSSRCIRAMVEAAVRRESSVVESRAALRAGEGQHRHRVPLGLVLLAQGWITHPQLQHALTMQRQAGRGRIGRWLIDEFGIKEEWITQGLSAQWNCPVLATTGFDPAAMALVLPRLLVDRLGLLPWRVAGRRILYLAFEDEMDAAAALALERMCGLKVESGLIDGSQWQAAHARVLACDYVEIEMERVPHVQAMASRVAGVLGELQPRASRLVRMHQFYWMRMWLESGAIRGGVQPGEGGIPLTREDVVDRIYEMGIGD
jgi:hypothetical protein